MKRAALFDFDGTLCPGDSIVPYLRFCIREGAAPATQWLRAIHGYLRQRCRPGEIVRAKEETLSYIRDRDKADMDELARRFLQKAVLPRLDRAVVSEMEKLRSMGVRIVILTASPDVYMNVLPELIPVDQVIATRCELNAEGRYTGRIGANCKGEQKVVRWRQADPAGEYEVFRAYGDSASDAPMLRLAREPVWVNPKRSALSELPDARILRTK